MSLWDYVCDLINNLRSKAKLWSLWYRVKLLFRGWGVREQVRNFKATLARRTLTSQEGNLGWQKVLGQSSYYSPTSMMKKPYSRDDSNTLEHMCEKNANPRLALNREFWIWQKIWRLEYGCGILWDVFSHHFAIYSIKLAFECMDSRSTVRAKQSIRDSSSSNPKSWLWICVSLMPNLEHLRLVEGKSNVIHFSPALVDDLHHRLAVVWIRSNALQLSTIGSTSSWGIDEIIL